jgi:hypothetical protein
MRLSIVVLTAGLALGAAQEPPLPTALKTAKTLYLVNGGVAKSTVDHTVAALRKWGRWTLVADAEASDVTLTLTLQPTMHVYNWATGTSFPLNSMFLSMTATANGAALYGITFRGSPENEFKKLRKRLEE